MSKEAILLPCPFCGKASDIAMEHVVSDGTFKKYWFRRCWHCQSRGPLERTKAWATRKWNARSRGVRGKPKDDWRARQRKNAAELRFEESLIDDKYDRQRCYRKFTRQERYV